MAVEEKIKRNHILKLENNRALSVSGVKNVPTFNDKLIVVELDNQNLLIGGENLNVTALDLESGNLSASGRILSLRYTSPHDAKTFFKRLFK